MFIKKMENQIWLVGYSIWKRLRSPCVSPSPPMLPRLLELHLCATCRMSGRSMMHTQRPIQACFGTRRYYPVHICCFGSCSRMVNLTTAPCTPEPYLILASELCSKGTSNSTLKSAFLVVQPFDWNASIDQRVCTDPAAAASSKIG